MDKCFSIFLGVSIVYMSSALCLLIYVAAADAVSDSKLIFSAQVVCYIVGLSITGIVPMVLNTEVSEYWSKFKFSFSFKFSV